MDRHDRMRRRRFDEPRGFRERVFQMRGGRRGNPDQGPDEPREHGMRGDEPRRPEPRGPMRGERGAMRGERGEHRGAWNWPRGERGEGRGPGREGRGWGRGGGPRVGRGDVRAAILALLAEQPMHGYELIQQIIARSGGVWRPSPGSVYPALQLLEDQGLIIGEPSEGRKVFHLTEGGQTYVKEHRAELDSAWSTVAGSVDDAVLELRDLIGQVGGALQQVAQVGSPAQITAAKTALINTRRQLYRILADDETTDGE